VPTENPNETLAVGTVVDLEDEPTVKIRLRRASEKQRHVTIRVVSGEDIFSVCVVYVNDQVVIGRMRSADLFLHDASVSRRHAALSVLEDSVVLEDLGSSNGTLYKGVPVSDPIEVEMGSDVELGGVTLRVERLTMGELTRLSQLRSRFREADLDPLCGVFSRRYLDDVVPEQLRGYGQAQIPVTACFLDVDNFRSINEAAGHATGDRVLRALALDLCESVRQSDSVVRYGGDEFLLLLPHCHEQSALPLADRVRRSIASRDWSTVSKRLSGPIKLSVSIGLAEYHGEAIADWIEAADRALYLAKGGGGDRIGRSSQLP